MKMYSPDRYIVTQCNKKVTTEIEIEKDTDTEKETSHTVVLSKKPDLRPRQLALTHSGYAPQNC